MTIVQERYFDSKVTNDLKFYTFVILQFIEV